MLSRLAAQSRSTGLGRTLLRTAAASKSRLPPSSAVRGIGAVATPQMLCMQCEQTSAGKGCTTVGICSKTPELAGLQDLQMQYNLYLAQLAHKLGSGPLVEGTRKLFMESTFATLTNVNFDDARFEDYLMRATILVDKMSVQLSTKPRKADCIPDVLPGSRKDLFKAAASSGLISRSDVVGNDDAFGVLEMATYGLKGLVAYFNHAEHLQAGYSAQEREEIYSEMFRIASYLAEAGNQPASADTLNTALGECLAIGALNLKVMKLLDSAHTSKYGTPGPKAVPTKARVGRHAILVSGHDLSNLYNVLTQTEGKGIDVYTHGEMLPAHGYPGLNKFEHLYGHFGTHWGNQLAEFRHFPGAVIMTSNCLRPPGRQYKDRIFTAGPVGFDGVEHIVNEDYSKVIEKALSLPKFDQASAEWVGKNTEAPESFTTGFGHAAVLSVADKIVDAVKSGALKHVFVIGGCDGTESKRNYFSQLGKDTPPDSIIITLGCGKFRLNGYDHGTLGGIPRLLDMGQCNDAYGAVVVATKLAEALGCTVHDLPLHFAVSWFEQKAVAVLLTLLHLGIKNIRIGPAVPAFLTPNVLTALNQKFGLMAVDVDNEDEDLEKMLRGQ